MQKQKRAWCASAPFTSASKPPLHLHSRRSTHPSIQHPSPSDFLLVQTKWLWANPEAVRRGNNIGWRTRLCLALHASRYSRFGRVLAYHLDEDDEGFSNSVRGEKPQRVWAHSRARSATNIVVVHVCILEQ
jgi:hypothetical protein